MKMELSKLLLVACSMLFAFACTQSAQPVEDNIKPTSKLKLSDCLVEVLSINLDEHELAAFTPKSMRVKGVFGEGDENYAIFDFALRECLVYNKKANKVERTFEIPKYDGWGESHLLEVVSWDSILYFDFEHQALVVCNPDEVKRTFDLKMDRDHHQPYQIIQHLHKFLRSIDGYIGFNAWIDYGNGGEYVDYDSLMDERNMVSFFKVQGDTVVTRDIPIKPYMRKTSFPDLMYYEVPFFEVNQDRREILVFHCTTDTLYTYDWDKQTVEKHVVSGSDIKIIPAKVPRKGPSENMLFMYENQERGFHYLYYAPGSGKYLRYLGKQFPKNPVGGIPPKEDILMLQVLNNNFEVEAEMDLPEGYSLSKRISNGIYLQKFDDERRELRVFKFNWQQASG